MFAVAGLRYDGGMEKCDSSGARLKRCSVQSQMN